LITLPTGIVDGAARVWMPEQASTVAPTVDFAFYFVYWVSAFFAVLITGLIVLFAVRYRHRRGVREKADPTPHHNLALEAAWTIPPTLLVVAFFWVGFRGFMDLATPPENAYEIQVTAQKWNWLFTYPGGYVDPDLHVPVDTPVRLVMSSQDVIHSFFVPAFRVKRDVVPGRYAKAWFEATRPGEFQLFCAEYCGTSHSKMLAKVVVHPTGEFERWLKDASNFLDRMPPEQAGEKLYQQRGCPQCHSVDGKGGIGPSFLNLFGYPQPLTGGGAVVADEDYIRSSILQPQAQIVAGYEPVMPTFQGRLTDREIGAIIAYMKSLSDRGGQAPAPAAAPAAPAAPGGQP
jgi:cytochrome c oxidase subunit 2